MGQIVVDVGSVDLMSHNGNTAYGTTRYFDIPANAGITSCVATFATHVNSGSFRDKAFSLNGARAHSSGSWPTSGISLNTALLTTGQNTFRVTINSQAVSQWKIGTIYLTINYNDVGGGDPPPPPNIGTITLNKSSMLAGETVTVNLSPCDNGIYRSIRVKWQGELITSLIIGAGVPSGGTYQYTFPLEDCSRMPNDNSGTLTFEMETSVSITVTKIMTINVPASVVPTIGTFTATRNANGVDASITNYVQNYSKVALAIGGELGALSSSIVSYEITGGGQSAATKTTTFGPFSQTGNITFTAKVTDSRGRTATKTATITILEYSAVKFSMPEAWRSSDAGVKNQRGTYARLKSGVSYSGLDGQNSATLKGRVYPKGGTAPAYTSMTPGTAWVTGGGLLLVTKTYIAQMIVQDKITSKTIEFAIPTKKTGISIMAGMRGAAVGKVAETPDIFESPWPIYINGIRGLTLDDIENVKTVFSGSTNAIIVYDFEILSTTLDTRIFFRIEGLASAAGAPVFTIAQAYWQKGSAWIHTTQKNLGATIGAIKIMLYNNKVTINVSGLSAWGALKITAMAGEATIKPLSIFHGGAEPSENTYNKTTLTIV